MRASKLLYLLLFVVFLLLSLSGFVSSLFYTKQSSVSQKLMTQTDQLKKIHQQHSDYFVGKTKLKNNQYPTFVFEDDQLVYWSEFGTKLPENYSSLPVKDTLIELKNGVYLSVCDKKGGKVIYTLLPLKRTYQVRNELLPTTINEAFFGDVSSIEFLRKKQKGCLIFKNHKGLDVFYCNVEIRKANKVSDIIYLASVLIALNLILYVVFGRMNQNNFTWFVGFLILLLGRGVQILFSGNYYFEGKLFDPTVYASSFLSSSYYDLLVNLFIAFFFAISLLRFNVWKLIRKVTNVKLSFSLLVLLSSLLCLYLYLSFYAFFHHSQWNFDVTEKLEVNFYQWIYVIVIIGQFMVYYLFHQFVSLSIGGNLEGVQKKEIVLLFIPVLIGAGLLYWMGVPLLIAVLHFLLLWITVKFRFQSKFLSLEQKSFVYIVSVIFFVALLVGLVNQEVSEIKKSDARQRFASKILTDGDLQGEFYLHEASTKIAKDPMISEQVFRPFNSKELIVRKIKKRYLVNYFDKYDKKVFIFDHKGNTIYSDGENVKYSILVQNYHKERYATDYKGLFYINDYNVTRANRLVNFVRITRKNEVVAYVVIQLTLKNVIPHSVFPRLLVDKRQQSELNQNDFSFSVFNNNTLQYSSGAFDYTKLDKDIPYASDFEQKGYRHHVFKGKSNVTVIVSTKSSYFGQVSTNASFVFMVLIFCSVILLGLYALQLTLKGQKLNYSTKIQLYLSLAYLVPLFVVSIVSLSVINTNYSNNQEQSFEKKAESINEKVNGILGDKNGSKIDDASLESLLNLAYYTENDINIYSQEGRLLFSSQPLIFNKGLMSERLNPKVVIGLKNGGKKSFIIEETIGLLNYNTIYKVLKSSTSGEVFGVLALPYFNSKIELESRKVAFISTSLVVFSLVFLVFMIFSYLTAKSLIAPLSLITAKIRKTTLGVKNEKIDWQTDDEIGLLVSEYNEMIEKLEQSKLELAQKEKESAWREMAQQVAHEIKNPLTPMKLSIQHLDRILPEEEEKIKKTLNTLLKQVEILDDIATSFSSFAKMPVPQSEEFDLRQVVNEITVLYSKDESIELTTDIEESTFNIIGDRKLMGRILTNLVLNGIQAVEESVMPHIKISLHKNAGMVLLRVTDNGAGIPDELMDKVFIPKFSTKSTGSGIGLAVAKNGVEHAGGKIWFETNTGKGTTFFIEWPLIS